MKNRIIFIVLLGLLIFISGFFFNGALWLLFVITTLAFLTWGSFSKKITRGKKIIDFLVVSFIIGVVIYIILRLFAPTVWRMLEDDVIYLTGRVTMFGDAHFAKYKSNQESYLNTVEDTIVARQKRSMKDSLGKDLKFDISKILSSYDTIESKDSAWIAGVEKRREKIYQNQAQKSVVSGSSGSLGPVYIGPNQTVSVELDSVWREITVASGLKGVKFLPSSKYFAYFPDMKKLYICGPQVGDTTNFGRHCPFKFLARTESGYPGVLTIITPAATIN